MELILGHGDETTPTRKHCDWNATYWPNYKHLRLRRHFLPQLVLEHSPCSENPSFLKVVLSTFAFYPCSTFHFRMGINDITAQVRLDELLLFPLLLRLPYRRPMPTRRQQILKWICKKISYMTKLQIQNLYNARSRFWMLTNTGLWT